MAIHKLQIDDFEETDYDLIAIHTALEDYRLAYFLNQQLGVRLYKTPKEVSVSAKQGFSWFSRFTFEDDDRQAIWDLVQNKDEIRTPQTAAIGLFGSENAISVTSWLLPEFKNVDFLLKIDHLPFPILELTSQINQIEQVTAVYTLNRNKIKSKNNLIF